MQAPKVFDIAVRAFDALYSPLYVYHENVDRCEVYDFFELLRKLKVISKDLR